MVSVPFQFNAEQHSGPPELSQFILNIQPVIPFSLNEDWNLIVRSAHERDTSGLAKGGGGATIRC